MPARAKPDGEIARIPLLFKSPEESLSSGVDRRSDYYRQQARQQKGDAPAALRQPIWTIPNILTFLRLVLVPVLMAVWETGWHWAPTACAIIFILASLTDWLDGYLARRLKIATVFGAFLDPVADKIMVCTALVLLTTSPPVPLTQRAFAVPVVIIICREITMSSLREWAAGGSAEVSKAVKVNSLGKWKTAAQMASMSVLLVCRQPLSDFTFLPHALTGSDAFVHLSNASFVTLWISTGLAIWSLATYMSNVWQHFLYPTHGKAS